jgi:hypothetical protein
MKVLMLKISGTTGGTLLIKVMIPENFMHVDTFSNKI